MKRILLCLVLLVFLCGCEKNAGKETISPTLEPTAAAEGSAAAAAETVIVETSEPAETDVVLPELTLRETEPAATEVPVSQPAAGMPAATEVPTVTEAPAEPETEVPWNVTEDGIELPMDPL